MRIGLIMNMVAPYTAPLFARLAEQPDCEILVVTETPMERDRHWAPETELAFPHVGLDAWTVDLAPLAVGSGFKTRFDTYLYLPKHPLAALREFRPDVVVAGGGGIWSSPANVAALIARRRHGWAFVPWWGSFTRPRPTLPRRIADPWVRAFMRFSDACLVYGTRQRQDAVELGADPSRTVIAPITALAPDPPLRRNGPVQHGTIRFLFVGRLIERKGLDVLLDAFDQLGEGELWIAGDGPLEPLAEAAAARNAAIRVVGHVAGEALAETYRRSDVLVVPSLYEPWGLVVHEGLAHGLPVIVTDQVGAADDLVVSGVNGYVVPPARPGDMADAMRRFISWTREQWERSGDESAKTLARVTVECGAKGFARGCALAVEHRRTRTAEGRSRGHRRLGGGRG